jgi:membrane protein DedA with SNARE-associated domain/membrane-associated phospholipid phosphatase
VIAVIAIVAGIVDQLLHLHGATALALVFLLPALESSAFLGFLFPGEIAVILGGVLASQGRFPLAVAAAAAVAGAFVGDSVGYAVGRRYGRQMLRGTVGRLPFIRHRLEAELGKAEAFVIRRGSSAVIIGRLTAALRVLVPGLAGIARMPYGRFAVANGIGAVLWGTGFTVAGYAAGTSYEKVQGAAGIAGLVFMAALVLGFVTTRVILGRRRRAAGVEPVPPLFEPVPAIASARSDDADREARRLADPGARGWARRRLSPRDPLGLPLTISVAAMVATGWAFSGLLAQVLQQDVTRFDPRALDFVVDHRTRALTGLMKTVTWLGSSVVILPLLAMVVAYLLLRRRDWRGAAVVAAAYAGAFGWSTLVKSVVERPRPPLALREVVVSGFAFPSGHATQAAAFYGILAVVLTARSRVRIRVAAWTAVLVVVGAVGLSRVYLGVHWLSDVLAGFALGALWVTVLAAGLLVSRRRRAAPAGRGKGPDPPERSPALSPAPVETR